MKRVLLAWELGGGTGYTGWLLDIARGLQARGHAVTLALREPVACIHQYASLDAPVLAAPVAPGRMPKETRGKGFFPCGFADLMMANGYGETHVLHALVRAWRGLIDLAKPDLIIGARDFGHMPFVRRMSNTIGRKSFSWALGREIRDNQSG